MSAQTVEAPLLPSIREALVRLLDIVPIPSWWRDEVRSFAREAGALGYAAGYSDGFEDGQADEQALAEDEAEEEIAPVVALHPGTVRLVPEQREAEQPRDDSGRWQDGPRPQCLSSFAPVSGEQHFQCELAHGHEAREGRLHETTDVLRGRRYAWTGVAFTSVQVLVPVDTFDALIRAVLNFDDEPDPDRMRRMAADLRALNLRDVTL